MSGAPSSSSLTSKSGSLIIVSLTQTPYTATVTSVTDNLGQTYVSAGARSYDSSGGYAVDIWYKSNSNTGVTSVTASYTGTYKDMEVTEVAGCRLVSPIDATAVINSGASTSAPVSAGITTTAIGDFVYIKTVPTIYNTSTVTSPYIVNEDNYGAYKTLGVPVSGESAIFGLVSPSFSSTYCSSTVAFFAYPSQVPEGAFSNCADIE